MKIPPSLSLSVSLPCDDLSRIPRVRTDGGGIPLETERPHALPPPGCISINVSIGGDHAGGSEIPAADSRGRTGSAGAVSPRESRNAAQLVDRTT